MRITLEITKSGKTKRIAIDGPTVLSTDWNIAAQQLAAFVPEKWSLGAYRQEWPAEVISACHELGR